MSWLSKLDELPQVEIPMQTLRNPAKQQKEGLLRKEKKEPAFYCLWVQMVLRRKIAVVNKLTVKLLATRLN